MTEPHTAPPEPRAEAGPRLRPAFAAMLAFVGALWAIKLGETLTGLELAPFGVYPRRLDGLDGVLWAPLVHGSWWHLFSNSAPLLVLGTALVYGYPRAARIVLPVLYLGTGLGVWLLARPAYHIGASGLAFGMLFFVFTIGVLRWEPRAIALAMIVSFLYGSMLWGIFPVDPAVSFESHLLGAVLGVALAFALRWRDPPRPRRRYSWEDDEDEVRDAPSTGPRDVPRTSLAPGVWLRATPAARRAPPSRCGCTPA